MSEKETRALVMDLRVGDTLEIPGGITLQLKQKKGQAARLCVVTPNGVNVKKTVAQRVQAAPSLAICG